MEKSTVPPGGTSDGIATGRQPEVVAVRVSHAKSGGPGGVAHILQSPGLGEGGVGCKIGPVRNGNIIDEFGPVALSPRPLGVPTAWVPATITAGWVAPPGVGVVAAPGVKAGRWVPTGCGVVPLTCWVCWV